MYPADLKYSKEHEWVKVEGKRGRIGLTHHAQHALGDVVFVEVPKVGRAVKQMEAFGVVESVKATSDIYAPMGGKVLAVNEELQGDPAVINSDPYGAGWIVRFQVSAASEYDSLLDAAAYTEHVQKEEEKGGH